jgi:threonine/homoserine/homoserine lactone efflux protein
VPAAYLSLTFLLAFTPGATTAMVIRHTLAGGRRRGLTVALGAALGNATQAVVALVGVSVLIARDPGALRVLGGFGAAFLAWLGIKSVRAAWRPRASPATSAGPGAPGHALREGIVVNVLNPSITGFYVGVVPTFVPAGASWRVAALFYLAHIAIAFACHTFWASVFHRARLWFAGERPRRWLDAAVGVVLIYLAIVTASR